MNIDEAIERVSAYFAESGHAVAFTGAGVSTESGIPDFRSPGGVWTKYQPVYLQDFLANEEARRRYWKMKKEGFWEMRNAKPNAGHLALARLEAAGQLIAIITQNIDALHQEAGNRRVVELHGNGRTTVCLRCDARYDSDAIQARLENGEEIPLCQNCGGLLKHATVSFGQALPEDVLAEAWKLAANADLVLAVGSSLVVEPAASLPMQAKLHGARLVIVNKTDTPLDSIADVVIRDSIGRVLADIADRVLAYDHLKTG